MWLTYLPGSCSMRWRASRIRASRSPNLVAPVGQISAQAVGFPAAVRLEHMSHLRTRGNNLFHSYLGTLKGQATMQYRQPMHFFSSYSTGPRGLLVSAPT